MKPWRTRTEPGAEASVCCLSVLLLHLFWTRPLSPPPSLSHIAHLSSVVTFLKSFLSPSHSSLLIPPSSSSPQPSNTFTLPPSSSRRSLHHSLLFLPLSPSLPPLPPALSITPSSSSCSLHHSLLFLLLSPSLSPRLNSILLPGLIHISSTFPPSLLLSLLIPPALVHSDSLLFITLLLLHPSSLHPLILLTRLIFLLLSLFKVMSLDICIQSSHLLKFLRVQRFTDMNHRWVRRYVGPGSVHMYGEPVCHRVEG